MISKRTIIAVVLAISVGIFAIPFVFSDLGPNEEITQRVVFASSIFFLGGALVGWVAIRPWFVSALCAWSPIGMGLIMLTNKVAVQDGGASWTAITVYLVVPLTLTVIGGYTGYKFRRRVTTQ